MILGGSHAGFPKVGRVRTCAVAAPMIDDLGRYERPFLALEQGLLKTIK